MRARPGIYTQACTCILHNIIVTVITVSPRYTCFPTICLRPGAACIILLLLYCVRDNNGSRETCHTHCPVAALMPVVPDNYDCSTDRRTLAQRVHDPAFSKHVGMHSHLWTTSKGLVPSESGWVGPRETRLRNSFIRKRHDLQTSIAHIGFIVLNLDKDLRVPSVLCSQQ